MNYIPKPLLTYYYFSLAFEIGSHVIQTGLELMTFLPQPKTCAIRHG